MNYRRLSYPAVLLFLTLLLTSARHTPHTVDPPGYENAPPCAVDVKRDFSVAKAIQALDRAARSNNPSAIKGEMRTASLNLEQVMNYGALKWGEDCMTCNPYASIDGDPNHSYMKVAWRLINFSRTFYQRSNYNEFMGLVSTMENNYQRIPYCGDVANATDVSTIADAYEFGRVSPTETVLCGGPRQSNAFVLTTNQGVRGRVLKACHPNESYYWYLQGEIIFLDANGYVTSILRRGSNDYWEGPFRGEPSSKITHYISRDNQQDPCLWPSWYGKEVPPEACYSGTFGLPGKNSWARDGNKYWLINSSGFCSKYFIVQGKNIFIYDRCQNLEAKLIFQRSITNDFGHQQWEGYTELPDGSRGRNWWMAWM